jgi:hypothetical protein
MRSRLFAFVAYQVLWFAVVIAAGHGHGEAASGFGAVFVAGQLVIARERALAVRLLVVALVLGVAIDGGATWLGLIAYASPWPWAGGPPCWILGLWGAFAITLLGPLRWLVGHPVWAAALGAIGGPLSYAGAQRGWGAVHFAAPDWHGYAWLAAGWAVAMALLSVVPGKSASGSAATVERQR